jgi:hypothetical protein
MGQNIQANTRKLLEENKQTFCDFGTGKNFLDRTQAGSNKRNIELPQKEQVFSLPKIPENESGRKYL